MNQRSEWLGLVNESILEPEIPICDPHHHLWHDKNNPYLLPHLLDDIGSGHNVVSTVFMECASEYRHSGPQALKPVGETEFVEALAASAISESRVCASIVGFADLALGAAVGEVLDAHLAASSRFVGIRHAAGWEQSEVVRNSHTNPPAHILGDATFRQGLGELGKRDLVFDAWLYHPQIPELSDLARAFPGQAIVVDHFGGPLGIGPYAGQADDVFAAWRHAIDELAQCDNVKIKLGGLAMPINGFRFHKAAQPATSEQLVAASGRYYRHAIEAFGPARCMFESNFPVDKASCSYAVLWNSFKRMAADFSDDEKALMFHDTAASTYRVS